jgi:hypothetical protein
MQMGRGNGEVYGFMHLPCRVELNSPLATAGPEREPVLG